MISLVQMAASGVLGAFIGYFTNAVAIRSLFRPLQPRWYTLGWQGVIPRNKIKLADNISRVVGEDLLHREYLVEQVQRPAVQKNLQGFISSRIEDVLGLCLADVFARLPAAWQEEGMDAWVERALQALADWSAGETTLEVKNGLLDVLEQHLRELELDEVLPPPQAEALAAALGTVLDRDETRAQLTRVLREQLEAYLSAATPLEEIVPAELRDLLHEKLREEVPAVMRRLVGWLATPENVEYMSQRILVALEAYADQESWLARLIGELGLRLFGEQIRSAIMARIPQVAHDYLHSWATRRKIEEQLVGGINSFLRRPLGEVTGRHRTVLAEKISFIAATWICSAEMQDHLGRFLLHEYGQHASRRLGTLLPDPFWAEVRPRLLAAMRVPKERVAAWAPALSAWLRARVRQSRTPFREWARLRTEDEETLAAYIREKGTELLRTEVPVLVEQLDITRIVHAKIMSFDLLKVERMIKNIISDQLRYINLLGALLGGLVGLALPFLNAFLRSVGL